MVIVRRGEHTVSRFDRRGAPEQLIRDKATSTTPREKCSIDYMVDSTLQIAVHLQVKTEAKKTLVVVS